MRKFVFYYNDKESEIYEYDPLDYDSEDDLIFQMELDRSDWLFKQFESGYREIK